MADPLKLLEAHWAYLTIMASRGERSAESGCIEVAEGLRDMEMNWGLSSDMVNRLVAILKSSERSSIDRAREVAGIIDAVVSRVKATQSEQDQASRS